ncbi:MAG TPA: hypothetical protein VFA07_08870 [Chthonomonadaceae bacterium]|nr:hypothetical protein [Chthonomonadaceae bacterium]
MFATYSRFGLSLVCFLLLLAGHCGAARPQPRGTLAAAEPTSSDETTTGGIQPVLAQASPTTIPFNTERDREIRKQMVATNNVWLPYLLYSASDPSGRIGIENKGTAGAYAYLYTGDATYARNAWSAMKPFATAGTLPNGNGANAIRILFGLYAICYRILRPTLSPADRQLYVQWMNTVAQKARTHFFTGNANGAIGTYLGLCLWSLISAPDNPAAASLLDGTFKDSGAVKPFGGLDYQPSLGPRGSARNAIRDYVAQSFPPGSPSGCWLEGTQYINAALLPLLIYTQAIDQITGKDHFPEVTAALPRIGRSIIGKLTNDLTAEFQFGDNEHPHALNIAETLPTVTILARQLEGTPEGAHLQFLINSWGKLYGYKGYACRMYLCMDPFAPAEDFRNETHPLNGSGLSVWRSGWSTTEDSIFGVNTDPASLVNHTQEDEVFRSFQLWRKGEWALAHPISYGGMGCFPDGNNTVVAGGLGVMWQHGATAWEDGPDYCYQRSETAGPRYPAKYFRQPDPYISEQTGSVLYVHGTNKTADIVIVADRVNATNPMNNPGWSGPRNRWRPKDAARIVAAETSQTPYGPLQWILHMPVSPTVQNGTIQWDVGSQHVLSQELIPSPAKTAFSTINEAATDNQGDYLYFAYGHIDPRERKWQVRETWADGQPWHFLLHAIAVYDGSGAPSIRAVGGNGVSGALVQPAGEKAVLALFSSDPASRLVRHKVTVPFTSAGDHTEVFLADLDTAHAWSAVLDGGSPVTIKPGSGGIYRLSVSGAGQHTLTLSPR